MPVNLEQGQVLEETPDGPMFVVQTFSPFGKQYALLTPFQPVWVEIQGDEVVPVPEKDIPLLKALAQLEQ